LLSNLALKVNLKMQGDNHPVNFMGLGSLRANKIVLDVDVTYPTGAQDSGRPSIAYLVGSVDQNLMNYPGSMRLQAGEIEDMRSMVKERLTAWQTANGGALPEYMVFYRDGISKSQFATCEKNEITAVRAVYFELCVGPNSGKKLKMTFVIVGKQHNARFYPTTPGDCTKNEENPDRSNMNARPGLLVDRVVTNPDRVNFYLQSHQAPHGTARSAHYHVLSIGPGEKYGEMRHVLTMGVGARYICWGLGLQSLRCKYLEGCQAS
ncbi:hypothetical protein EJ02DRAFT_357355, partial [Clathrospora elynae]